MNTHKMIILDGYQIRGVDLRDDTEFSDFCVVEAETDCERDINQKYSRYGYRVEAIMFEQSISVPLDLLEMYLRNAAKSAEKSAAEKQEEPTDVARVQPPSCENQKTPKSHEGSGYVNPNKAAVVEKKAIAAKLVKYREKHGLGCLVAVEKATKGKVSEPVIRDMLTGGRQKIEVWRIVGAGLEKLEAEEQEKAE